MCASGTVVMRGRSMPLLIARQKKADATRPPRGLSKTNYCCRRQGTAGKRMIPNLIRYIIADSSRISSD